MIKAFFGITAVVAAPAWAQTSDLPTAPAVTNVVACRSQTAAEARLACYDAGVEALSRSLSAGEVVAVARDDVRKKGKSWFGLGLPDLKLFGDRDDDPQPTELTAKIKAARDLGYGKWVISLDTGGHWQLTETLGTRDAPRVGQNVRIEKTRLGGYMLSIEDGRLLRVKRIQ